MPSATKPLPGLYSIYKLHFVAENIVINMITFFYTRITCPYVWAFWPSFFVLTCNTSHLSLVLTRSMPICFLETSMYSLVLCWSFSFLDLLWFVSYGQWTSLHSSTLGLLVQATKLDTSFLTYFIPFYPSMSAVLVMCTPVHLILLTFFLGLSAFCLFTLSLATLAISKAISGHAPLLLFPD